MLTDAPDEPNAVRDDRSLGVMEGVAEYRAVMDFDNFAPVAGYSGLVLAQPQYPGPFAAMDDLVAQVSGPSKDRQTLLKELVCGPGALHSTSSPTASSATLADVVPNRPADQQAVRAALIIRLANPLWPGLLKRPATSGLALAGEIRQHLNSEVDKIRHHYRAPPTGRTRPTHQNQQRSSCHRTTVKRPSRRIFTCGRRRDVFPQRTGSRIRRHRLPPVVGPRRPGQHPDRAEAATPARAPVGLDRSGRLRLWRPAAPGCG